VCAREGGANTYRFAPRHSLKNFVWRGSTLMSWTSAVEGTESQVTTKRGYESASVAVRAEKRAIKSDKLIVLFSETETAKQNQKFPFHFFRFAAEGWGEEAREKCKEIFWFLHTRVRERVRGALVRITTQSERTIQSRATTHAERAKSVRVLLEMGSNFFKQTPHFLFN